ncbi:MAG: hypothetical protein E7625_01495 [Ruminococcaceae bacterium]|nr:hypothetical protein [Oscillospiraceae bacterium]
MKGKIWILRLCTTVLALFLILTLTMCGGNRSARRKATLIVNGTTVEKAQAYLHGEYPLIPLAATFAACGYEVERVSSDVTRIVIDGTEYTVDLKNLSMTAEGSTVNLLASPSGEMDSLCERSGKEVLVFCYRLGTNLSQHTNVKFTYSTNLNTRTIYVEIHVVTDK